MPHYGAVGEYKGDDQRRRAPAVLEATFSTDPPTRDTEDSLTPRVSEHIFVGSHSRTEDSVLSNKLSSTIKRQYYGEPSVTCPCRTFQLRVTEFLEMDRRTIDADTYRYSCYDEKGA